MKEDVIPSIEAAKKIADAVEGSWDFVADEITISKFDEKL